MVAVIIVFLVYALNIIYRQADKQDKEKLDIVTTGNIVVAVIITIYEIIRLVI